LQAMHCKHSALTALRQRHKVVVMKKEPMEYAFLEAEAAAKRGEVPVGAIVVDCENGHIIARAGNRVEELNDASAHAEMLALRQASLLLETPRLEKCDVYVTLEPCPMCAGLISMARVRRLYFAAFDAKSGGVDHGARVFDHPTCHHRPEIIGGVHESRAEKMLQDFFKKQRNK